MKYTPELRAGRWFAVDREAGVELACWFDNEVTCAEIGRRTEADDTTAQFMNGIPVVLADTPAPRPEGTNAVHPKAVRQALAQGKTAKEIFARHPRNPLG